MSSKGLVFERDFGNVKVDIKAGKRQHWEVVLPKDEWRQKTSHGLLLWSFLVGIALKHNRNLLQFILYHFLLSPRLRQVDFDNGPNMPFSWFDTKFNTVDTTSYLILACNSHRRVRFDNRGTVFKTNLGNKAHFHTNMTKLTSSQKGKMGRSSTRQQCYTWEIVKRNSSGNYAFSVQK